MKDRARVLIELKGKNVGTALDVKELTQEGLAVLCMHLRYLERKIQEKYESNLRIAEEGGEN